MLILDLIKWPSGFGRDIQDTNRLKYETFNFNKVKNINNNYIYNVVGLVGTLYSSNNNIANSVGGILVSGNNVANSVGGLINSNICSMYHQLNFIQANAINPLYVTGFIDGEGCFHISITKKKKYKSRLRSSTFFSN